MCMTSKYEIKAIIKVSLHKGRAMRKKYVKLIRAPRITSLVKLRTHTYATSSVARLVGIVHAAKSDLVRILTHTHALATDVLNAMFIKPDKHLI